MALTKEEFIQCWMVACKHPNATLHTERVIGMNMWEWFWVTVGDVRLEIGTTSPSKPIGERGNWMQVNGKEAVGILTGDEAVGCIDEWRSHHNPLDTVALVLEHLKKKH